MTEVQRYNRVYGGPGCRCCRDDTVPTYCRCCGEDVVGEVFDPDDYVSPPLEEGGSTVVEFVDGPLLPTQYDFGLTEGITVNKRYFKTLQAEHAAIRALLVEAANELDCEDLMDCPCSECDLARRIRAILADPTEAQ